MAIRVREHVAWSTEAAFPVAGTELVGHCHFTGEAPHLSSDRLTEAANQATSPAKSQAKGLRLVAPARLHPPLRNSWGLDRGMAGYFTIPYSSPIQPGLAADFWVIRQVR